MNFKLFCLSLFLFLGPGQSQAVGIFCEQSLLQKSDVESFREQEFHLEKNFIELIENSRGARHSLQLGNVELTVVNRGMHSDLLFTFKRAVPKDLSIRDENQTLYNLKVSVEKELRVARFASLRAKDFHFQFEQGSTFQRVALDQAQDLLVLRAKLNLSDVQTGGLRPDEWMRLLRNLSQ